MNNRERPDRRLHGREIAVHEMTVDRVTPEQAPVEQALPKQAPMEQAATDAGCLRRLRSWADARQWLKRASSASIEGGRVVPLRSDAAIEPGSSALAVLLEGQNTRLS